MEIVEEAQALSDRDLEQFNERFQQYQEELAKTSRVLEDHKKRQGDQAKSWHKERRATTAGGRVQHHHQHEQLSPMSLNTTNYCLGQSVSNLGTTFRYNDLPTMEATDQRRNGESHSQFNKRLAQMQTDLDKTSQRLENYKLRQGEVVKKWHIDKRHQYLTPKSAEMSTYRGPYHLSSGGYNAGILSNKQLEKNATELEKSASNNWSNLLNQQVASKNQMLAEMASSVLLDQQNNINSNSDMAQQKTTSQGSKKVHNGSHKLPEKIMRLTETSPLSNNGRGVPPRLDYQDMINSGRQLLKENASLMSARGLVAYPSNPNNYHKDQHERGSPLNNDDEYLAQQQPDSKRDQKISYSKTSLDEIQFMEHMSQIRAQEEHHNFTPPPMPLTATMRSQNTNASYSNGTQMVLMSTKHKNNYVAPQMTMNHSFHGNRPPLMTMTPHIQQAQNRHNHQSHQKLQYNQTTPLYAPPAQQSTKHSLDDSLHKRLDHLNELIITQPATDVQTPVSTKTRLTTSAERALSYLDTMKKRDLVQNYQRDQPQPQPPLTLQNQQQYYQNQQNLDQTRGVNSFEQHQVNALTNQQQQLQYMPNETQQTQFEDPSELEVDDQFVQEEMGHQIEGQLMEILQRIGIGEAHLWKFKEQEIGLYDFLLLSKEDLLELQLPIAARNRVVAFQRHYANEGFCTESGTPIQDFDMDEVIKQFAKKSDSVTPNFRRQWQNNTQLTENHDYSQIIEPNDINIVNSCEAPSSHQQSQEKKDDTGRKRRPRTTQGMYKKQDLAQKVVADYDDYLISHQQQQPPRYPTGAKGKIQNHFQSAMTQMMMQTPNGSMGQQKGNSNLDYYQHQQRQQHYEANSQQTSSSCGYVNQGEEDQSEQQFQNHMVNNEGDQQRNNYNNSQNNLTSMNETTTTQILASSPTGHDDISIQSKSPSSIQLQRYMINMQKQNQKHSKNQQRSSSVNVANHRPPRYTPSSVDYNQQYNQKAFYYQNQQQYNNNLDRDRDSVVNTLSTSHMAPSRASQIYVKQEQHLKQSKSKGRSKKRHKSKSVKRRQARTLYKELKKLILKGGDFDNHYTERSNQTKRQQQTNTFQSTGSIQSLLMDQIYKKISQKYMENSIANSSTTLDRKALVKRELKKIVRKMLGHKNSSRKNSRSSNKNKSQSIESNQQQNQNSTQKMLEKWQNEQNYVAKKRFQAVLQTEVDQNIDDSILCNTRQIIDNHPTTDLLYSGDIRIGEGRGLQTQQYSMDQLESTHDFGKEDKGLVSEPNFVQAQETASGCNPDDLSYQNTNHSMESGRQQQNKLQQEHDLKVANLQYLSHHSSEIIEQEKEEENYRVNQLRDTKNELKSGTNWLNSRAVPHGQTYSFGFVTSNPQLLSSEETRTKGSTNRLLKTSTIITNGDVAVQQPQLINKHKFTANEQTDYIEQLKLMQKGGQLGSLGLGNIDLDKIHHHLLQSRPETPSANETRVLQQQQLATRRIQEKPFNSFSSQSNNTHKHNQQIISGDHSSHPVSSGVNSEFNSHCSTLVNQNNGFSSRPDDNRRFANSHLTSTNTNNRIPTIEASQNSTLLAQVNRSQHGIYLSENYNCDGESQETERLFSGGDKGNSQQQPNQTRSPIGASEVEIRKSTSGVASQKNKELLQKAKKDIAQMNEKAAAFKNKLELAKRQMGSSCERPPSSATAYMIRNNEIVNQKKKF